MAEVRDGVFQQARRWGPRLLAGAIAGMVAAVPMAFMMNGLNRLFSDYQATPPKQITARLSFRAWRRGLPSGRSLVKPGKSWGVATWLSHLGYGAATASLYPLVTRPLPLPGVLRGILFALSVWAFSYLGWLPAMNLQPPATKKPARRNAVAILSHIVWGSLIGLLAGWLNQQIAGAAQKMGAARSQFAEKGAR